VQDFLSYCRLVKRKVSTASKIKRLRGTKFGNHYLRRAFGEAAVLGKRHHENLDTFSRHRAKSGATHRRSLPSLLFSEFIRNLDLIYQPADDQCVKKTSNEPDFAGKLILADPSLRGGIFHKSVVLLADHSAEEGAMGLILNQPAGHTVGDLLKSDEFTDLRTVQVHIGGPVAKSHLSFAAFWSEKKSFRFKARISAEDAIRYVHRPGAIVRAFVGYSGWDKNQLEDEIEQQSWITVLTKPELLSVAHDPGLWKTIMEGISPFHYILSKAPDEILSN